MPLGTLLVMSPLGIPLYSARQLTQTLTPIEAAKPMRRTINFEIRSLSLPGSYKYDTTITATDIAPPAIDGWWPGMGCIISCVAELAYPTGGTPQRTPVAGSQIDDGSGFTRYRPIISCLFVDFQIASEEWTAGIPWTLKFTEL